MLWGVFPPFETPCPYFGRRRELNDFMRAGLSVLAEWDEMVMMPEGGSELRGEQKAAIAGVLHEKSTDAILGQLISQLAADASLSDVQKAVVREAKRRCAAV